LRIGIPRALLYHWYGKAWESFLLACGFTPVVSPPTGRRQVELGVRAAQDEICLPVKVFMGHVRYLAEVEKVDAVFVPHQIQVEKNRFICPKFMGLPDMVRAVLPRGMPMLLWLNDRQRHLWSVQAVDGQIRRKLPKEKIRRALSLARQVASERWTELAQAAGSQNQGLQIGVIAHPYCLYDGHLSMDLLGRLRAADVQVLTPEMTPDRWLQAKIPGLNKPLFWTLGRRIMAAALYYAEQGVDGVIHLAAFGCGPESVVGELVARRLQEHGIPLLGLNLDEHTGEAGFATRLEAFLDLVTRRKSCCG